MSEQSTTNEENTGNQQTNKPESRPHRIRLPGFISDKDIGLGDVIKRVTSSVGIKPCVGCARRAAALNRWMVFSGPRSR